MHRKYWQLHCKRYKLPSRAPPCKNDLLFEKKWGFDGLPRSIYTEWALFNSDVKVVESHIQQKRYN